MSEVSNAFTAIDRHISNIEALFIKGNKRIAELEAGVREIHSMARTVGYDSGHTGIETICKRLLRK